MKKALTFVLFLCAIGGAFSATHSLKYFHTAVSGIPDVPEFTEVGLVDDEPFVHCDSNSRRTIPKTEWIEKNVGKDYWDGESQKCVGNQQVYKANIEVAKSRFNQTGGVHTVQRMYGCVWDDQTGTTDTYIQFGYDGNDFIALDFKTMTYVAPVPQALLTKHKWDNDRGLLDSSKNYFTVICIEWLKKYVNYAKSTLEKTVPPEVSLLQRDPSAPVTCHATGFYPKDVMMSWRKNDDDVLEDVNSGEIIPNADGTYQARSHLSVKPEEWKRNTYSCVVQHRNSKDIVVEVKEGNIRTNHSGIPWLIIIGCVAAVLVAVGIVAGIMVWRKRSTDYKPAAASDSGSENSVPQKV